jgi:hypothetical protein
MQVILGAVQQSQHLHLHLHCRWDNTNSSRERGSPLSPPSLAITVAESMIGRTRQFG